MSVPVGPTPDKVMQWITGGWAAAILGSAARHGVFNALEGDGDHAEGVAKTAGISLRGAQAVLDGLTGLGLISHSNERYQNSPEASAFLVKGKPVYLGGMAEVMTDALTDWAKLPDAVKTGRPTASNTTDMADNEFWHVLVPAIAGLSFPVAQMAAERLGIATAGSVSWLDVGGGHNIFPENPALAEALVSRCSTVVAVDPSANVHDNRFVQERVQAFIEDYRTDQQFDLAEGFGVGSLFAHTSR